MIDDTALYDRIHAVLEELSLRLAGPDPLSRDEAVKVSHELSTHFKTLRELRQDNLAHVQTGEQKYTAYEKRPPLSPAEHDQLLERFFAVFDIPFPDGPD